MSCFWRDPQRVGAVEDITELLDTHEDFWAEMPPPSSVEANSELIGFLFAPDARSPDVGFEDVKERGTAGLPANLGFVTGSLRLRRRGRLTNALAKAAESLPIWWEDLDCSTPAAAALRWMESHLKDSGAKVGVASDVGLLEGEGLRSLPVVQVHFSSEEGSRWLWVCPELLAHLFVVRLFRPVSEALLGSLRSKARLWSKEIGLPAESLARFLPGTLSLALLPTPDEVVAVGALRGSAGQWSTEVLGALSRGNLQASNRGGSWWDVLKPSLRFGGTRGEFLGGEGCSPLRLAA
jgi:hypothetical protein